MLLNVFKTSWPSDIHYQSSCWAIWVNLRLISLFTAEAPVDRWHSWPVTHHRNGSVLPAALSCSILTRKPHCTDVYVHARRFYLDLHQQHPVYVLVLLPPLPLSFLSAEEVQGVTWRPSGLGPCNQARAGAVTVWHCVLSKNISPSNGAALFCPDLFYSSLLSSLFHQFLHPSLPYLCVVQAALQPMSRLFFFFNQHPDDPVLGP